MAAAAPTTTSPAITTTSSADVRLWTVPAFPDNIRDEVVATVDVTSGAEHLLWSEWFSSRKDGGGAPLVSGTFGSDGPGFWQNIGSLDSVAMTSPAVRDVCIRVHYRKLNERHLVALWEVSSRYADFDMARQWMHHHFAKAALHTDTRNFAHVLGHCRQLDLHAA